MGRHSAPDTELDAAELELTGAVDTVEVAPADAGVAAGRHARADDDEPAQHTDAAERLSGTRADLQLLRGSRALRLRCAAAVVVPFAVYTALLVLLGRTDVYLIWVWIPTVLAGVLVGTLLDLAHRRLNAPPADRP